MAEDRLNIFFAGGLNEQDDLNIDLNEATQGENFSLEPISRIFTPRKPQDKKGTAPVITGTPAGVTSIMQLITRSDSETTLVVSDNALLRWDGTSVFSNMATVVTGARLRDTFWSLDDLLLITDLDHNEKVMKWDGTDFLRLKTSLTASTGTSTAEQISRSGSVATVTQSAHGYATDDLVTISGTVETQYNGEFQATVVDANSFTYPVTGSPATPATTATGGILSVKGVELFAKYAAVFNGRSWLANIKADSTETQHMILASKFEDTENLDPATRSKSGGLTGNEPFFLLSPDLRPVNGMIQFFNVLVISTIDGKLFKLTGSDSTDYDWAEFYKGSAATGEEAMVDVGNDMMYMRRDKNIDLLSSTERFGDINADDVSRFIPNQIATATNPIAIYDQKNQLVLFFIANKVLVYSKDAAAKTPFSPWTVYTTGMTNRFNTKAAKYLRIPGTTKTAGGYTVYWGDDTGRLFDLNGTGTDGDDTKDVIAFRRTKNITELDTMFEPFSGRVEYRRKGAVTLNMTADWAEEYNAFTCALPLKGPLTSGDARFYGQEIFYGESIFYGEGTVAEDKVSTVGFSMPGKGPGFFMRLEAQSKIPFVVNRVRT